MCKTKDKILVAVSGGIDSMVMLDLFTKGGFSVGVAHCNFRLREIESDKDENFVREEAARRGIACFVKNFETSREANERGISIQMAARDLRYEFFDAVARMHQYDFIATAHHFNDVIESVFMNLIRGTGLDGLSGITVRKENIIRPLLFATRAMIEAYAAQNAIDWREDSSNASDHYFRNHVRLNIVPELRKINPSFEEGFRLTHDRLNGAAAFARTFIDDFRRKAVRTKAGEIHIDISMVRNNEYPAVLLWEIIKANGFSYDQCLKMIEDHQPGKVFESQSHLLIVDRKNYIIEAKKVDGFHAVDIEKTRGTASSGAFSLSLTEVGAADFKLRKESSIAQLDVATLRFPLRWRKWQAGDYFVPLGMKQEKKLSDFLIDLKIPFNAKADVTVLESNGQIVWVVGERISDRFKVTDQTKTMLVIEYHPDQTKK